MRVKCIHKIYNVNFKTKKEHIMFILFFKILIFITIFFIIKKILIKLLAMRLITKIKYYLNKN